MHRLTGIKVISFDGDGTLWDFEEVMRYSLQHVLEELKKLDADAADMIDIDKMIRIRFKVANELKGKVTNLEVVRLESFRQTLKDIGRPNDALAFYLNQVYLKHRFEDIELFNDVLPALKELRAKYALGLVSNGNSYPERCGLKGVFQFVVFSQDYGVEKPNPELFHIAVKKAKCSKQEFIHVGDSLKNDIVGANNAGIKFVWLNRKKVENDLNIKIEYEISSLLELLEIL